MKPPIAAVCLPGTLCDDRLFAPLIARLPVDATVVDFSDCRAVEDAAAKVLALAPERFVGIGFSLGGFVLLEMLRRAPERLRAVILIAGNSHPDDPAKASGRRSAVEDARRSGMPALIATNWPRYVAVSALDHAAIRALVVEMAEAIGHDGHAAHAEINIARPDLREVAAASPVPILVIAGAEDRLCPRERYEIAASGTRGRIVVLEDVGHFVPLEAPDAAAAAIAVFLDEIDA